MRALAAAIALVWAAPAAAFLGPGEAHKAAVIWMPDASFSDWARVEALFRQNGSLRLTVALWPEMVTPEAEKVLAPLIEDGRVEVALRLKGDPILPLIARHPRAPRPEDPLERLAAAREQYRLLFSTWPAGFVPGGGALAPEVFPALKALGFAWAAAGPYTASSSPWRAAGATILVPVEAPAASGAELSAVDLTLPEFPRPAVFVVNEAGGLAAPGTALRLLEGPAGKSSRGWWTVAEAAAARRQEAQAPVASADWPTWTGGTAAWDGRPDAQRAWELYGQAALEVAAYQNSGSADLKVLESAAEALYEAQAERWYRLVGDGPEAAAADRGLRERLRAVYSRLRRSPPDTLFKPFTAALSEEDEPAYKGARVSQGQSWLALENPPGSVSKAPADLVVLPDGTPASALWKPLSLRVEWGPQGLSFTYRMARIGGEPAAGAAMPELGRLKLETYIDLNNVTGAGTVALLARNLAFIQARDAWEYALSVSAKDAVLYRSNPLGAPLETAKLGVEVDSGAAEVRVRVPPNLLKGSPQRWGFVVLAADGESGEILGLIAPLDQQKSFLSGSGRQRLAAVRAAGG